MSVSIKGNSSSNSEETNLYRLKKRLAWACASDLVPVSADVRTQMSDAERERRMIEELHKCISRIRDARFEYDKAEEVFATNLPPVAAQLFRCTRCGNRDPMLIFADPRMYNFFGTFFIFK